MRNEMLNRTAVTSQGAKARRMLLEAMIERGADADLGLEGYGPEVAMYHAFLKGTGLHGWDQRNEVMVFRSPTDKKFAAGMGTSRIRVQPRPHPSNQSCRHLRSPAVAADWDEGRGDSRLRHGWAASV